MKAVPSSNPECFSRRLPVSKIQAKWFSGLSLSVALFWSFVALGEEDQSQWLGPAVMAVSDQSLYVGCARSPRLVVLDGARGGAIKSIWTMPDAVSGCTVWGDQLVVTCSGRTNIALSIDRKSGIIRRQWSVRAGACAPVIHPQRQVLFICNRFECSVSVFDLDQFQEISLIPAGREPVAAALAPGGTTLLVANALPSHLPTETITASVISVIDTRNDQLIANLCLPSGSVGARGFALSPDGKVGVVSHNFARFRVPTTQLENGWMNDSAISLVDLENRKLLGTVLLDDPRRGASNPWGIAWSASGQELYVAHSGTHELSVIDAQVLLQRVKQTKPGGLIDHLNVLQGIRRRIALPGRGPREVIFQNGQVWVSEFFTDSISRVDASNGNVQKQIQFQEKGRWDPVRKGEQLFHDATLSYQSWQSCASCHPDGRGDGLTWDLLNDGIGNPKKTKSLLYAHQTPPAMSLGVRETAEQAVRSGLRHILFAHRREEEAQALDEYLKSLRPIPSPYLVGGKLSAAALRGQAIFSSSQTRCSHCHSGPLLTDLRQHWIGTEGERDAPESRFDTPSLIECWRNAPYLHDGSAKTVNAVLTRHNAHNQHGQTSHLSPSEVEDLEIFVLSQ